MILPEIVRCARVQTSILHLETLRCPTACPIRDETLIEFVVLAQTFIIKVLVCTHAIIRVHTVFTVTRANRVPGLTCLLIVADVLVTQLQRPVIIIIGKATIVTARVSVGTMYIAICSGVVVCTIQYNVV